MTKKFAVVLSGCGVFDGAEIHEAVMTFYAITQNKAQYNVFAPDMDQHHVINHLTGKEMAEKRNVLVESARIARGQISALKNFVADDFDAIILPGGFGVAKNLSSFAFDGANCTVDPDLKKAVVAMHKQGKPIGALCISPAVIAQIIKGAKVTIGQDGQTIDAIQNMGGTHQISTHAEVIVDYENKIFSTPCYMLDATITDIAAGADNIVRAMIETMKA